MSLYIDRIESENVYFWSDLHLRHDRPFILGPRNYTDVNRHDSDIRMKLQSLPSDSVLFLLGDSVFGTNAAEYLEGFLKSISPKEIILMPGNHFSGLKEIKNTCGRRFELGDKTVRIIDNMHEIRVGEQFIVLSHYPVISWNKMGKGSWMIHGHTHGNLINTEIGKLLYKAKIIDVGVECQPRPVSFREVRDIMDKKDAVTFDHHGHDINT